MISCHSALPSERHPRHKAPYAVFLMAYGGPTSLDDIEGFLLDIRGGRQTPAELIEEIKERYALIGGKSPLLEITCDQAEALEACLNTPPEGETELPHPPFRVYVGMRHWNPYIKEAMTEMVQDGIKNVVALCMTPYYSEMTVGNYVQKFREAQTDLCVDLNVVYIKNWHTHPLYIETIAEKVQAALKRFPDEVRQMVQLVFTAHSLPASVIERGDPYEDHLKETMNLILERLEMGAKPSSPLAERARFCYQSAGARQVKWLGPQIEEVLEEMAGEGHKHILVVPIGFLCDHVEILYDIDIECQELAHQHDITLKRTDSMNTTPHFIESLADIVRQAIVREYEPEDA